MQSKDPALLGESREDGAAVTEDDLLLVDGLARADRAVHVDPLGVDLDARGGTAASATRPAACRRPRRTDRGRFRPELS